MKLKNRVAVVTGGSTGIGRVIATELAKEGADLILIARTYDRLKETKRLIERVGGKAEIILADLSDSRLISRLISEIKSRIKRVDILINVAGVWHGKNEVYANKKFETYPQKIILDTYSVGLIAPTLLAHGLISLMPKGGRIINISGTFENGAKGWLPYYVSKRAIEDLTVGLAEELKEKNIQVNCISPSDTATEAYKKYFPQYLEEAIDPKKIATYAVDLCSSKKARLTGQVMVVKKERDPFEGFHY